MTAALVATLVSNFFYLTMTFYYFYVFATLAVTLAVVTLVTVGTDAFRIDPQEEGVRASSTILDFANNNPDISATLAADLLPCADRNKLQLELAGRAPIVPSGGDYGDGAIVGPKDWPDAEGGGLSKVPFTTWEDAAIWAKLQAAN